MPVETFREAKKSVMFIVGPTAIGKTAFSIKLARHINGEIISCDSMQVYKGMEILSQAPKLTETKKVRHHLIKFLSPQKEFSVAAFRKKAAKLIDDIIRRKKIPIVVGGSGLYVKGLIDGLFPSPPADMRFRKKMYDYAARYGSAHLHEKLAKIDPDAAHLIHPNDARRVIRALEIRHSTGKTMTELKNNTRALSERYSIKIFGLTAPRKEIYLNINNRVDKMFASGVIDEVKKLLKKKLSRTARTVLGFKQIASYLKGEYDFEAARELIKRNTRRFAKRQLTWFRADNRIKWFDIAKVTEDKILKLILKEIE